MAIPSLTLCEQLQKADVIPSTVKFQISLPTPIAPTYNNMVPPDRPALLPALTEHLISEVVKIASAIPNVGLVHYDDAEGDAARIARRHHARIDGVAIECGMARGDPARLPAHFRAGRCARSATGVARISPAKKRRNAAGAARFRHLHLITACPVFQHGQKRNYR
jgi:hypothetical protein